ncbi:MAG: restriction endonuclease subunit S [Rhizonema sp. PD37]|nr:restriction endonuclease subunit S [Rhizonema sp. PD37]
MTEEQQIIQITDYYAHKVVAPQSWTKALFSDVCKIVGGSQPPKEYFVNQPQDGCIRLIQIRDYKTDKFATYIPIELAKRFCNKDDIMIGRYGPPIFQILRGLDGAYNVALMKAIPNAQLVDQEFLYYFLQTPNLFNYVAAASLRTAGQDGVKKEHLDNYPLFIPPLNEQRRIVAKIEALRARSQRVKETLEAIPPLLNQFRQSVLAAAFRGDLTADWREKNPDVEPASVLLERIRTERRRRWEEAELEKMRASGKLPKDEKWKLKSEEYDYVDDSKLPELPNEWCWTNLQSIALVKDPNPSHRYPSYEGGTVPLISTREFQGLSDWNVKLSPFVTEEFYQYQNKICNFSQNDIIFARKGKIGLARRPPKLLKYTFSHTIFVIKCFESIFSESVLWYIRQNQVIVWLLREMNSNNGVPTLGKAVFEKTPIPFAPIAEQKEIVRRIEFFFKAADTIERQYQEAKAYIDQLDQSILTKAFRGELVPQNPDDEPASILLERIRSERDKLQASAKTAKKSTSKTDGQRSQKVKWQDAEPVQLELPVLE